MSPGLSFYAPVPEAASAEDHLLEYERFLTERNGRLAADAGFERRDALMDDLAALPGRYEGVVDEDRLRRANNGDDVPGLSEEELAVLAFVKVNAGEAYGVEIVTAARERYHRRDEPLYRVERVLGREETYHTRMLLGVTNHFGDLDLGDGWRPPLPLKVLIFALAKAPAAIFHPILLGAEYAGVYTFNWLLERTKSLFPDQPDVRESMERRLIEILIDEVGHVAYNRIAVGNAGLRVARSLSAQVTKSQDVMNPEAVALGFNADARSGVTDFDHRQLPEEVRRRAFFV